MNCIAVITFVVAFCAVCRAGTVSEQIACAEKVRTGSCVQGCISSLPQKVQKALNCVKDVADSVMPSIKSCIVEQLGNEQCFDISNLRNELHRLITEHLPSSASGIMPKFGSCVEGCLKDAACDSTCTAKPDPLAAVPVADCVKTNVSPSVFDSLKRCISVR